MKLVYPAIFTPYENSKDGYVAEFPDLSGCVTQGDNLAEALFMAEDAASGWILTELEDGGSIPKATPLKNVKTTEPGQFVNLIALDINAYAAKYSSHMVKTTVTIPTWLDTFAKEKGINCSKVFQDALLQIVLAQ